MKDLLIGFLIMITVLIEKGQTYFLNTNAFYYPAAGATSGSVLKKSGTGNQKVQYFGSGGPAPIKKQPQQTNPQAEVQALRQMYKIIGISPSDIDRYYAPMHKNLIDGIDWWYTAYYEKRIHMSHLVDLEQRIKTFKMFTDLITNNYLSNVDKIIIGSGNRVIGRKIFINGNNSNVIGSNIFVFNQINNQDIFGRNIVRAKSFQIDFDQIPQILKGNIERCLKKIY